MSLDDELTTTLNLSVEDIQNVATQLLSQDGANKINKEISIDLLCDSDGFTSESSDTNAILRKGTLIDQKISNIGTSTTNSIVVNSLSSNISDSDTGSVFSSNVEVKSECEVKSEYDDPIPVC